MGSARFPWEAVRSIHEQPLRERARRAGSSCVPPFTSYDGPGGVHRPDRPGVVHRLARGSPHLGITSRASTHGLSSPPGRGPGLLHPAGCSCSRLRRQDDQALGQAARVGAPAPWHLHLHRPLELRRGPASSGARACGRDEARPGGRAEPHVGGAGARPARLGCRPVPGARHPARRWRGTNGVRRRAPRGFQRARRPAHHRRRPGHPSCSRRHRDCLPAPSRRWSRRPGLGTQP